MRDSDQLKYHPMKTVQIAAEARVKVGSKDARALRSKGNVPCVLYGNKENVHFFATSGAFNEVLTSPEKCLVKIRIGEKQYDSILKDAQYHPISDDILHLDFLELVPGKEVTTVIPVRFIGRPLGVLEGGHLTPRVRNLKVKGKPEDLRDFIEIDVSGLGLGKSIKVSEVSELFPKLEILNPGNIPLATVDRPRLIVEPVKEAAPAAAEVEEGAEKPAEGEKEKEEKKEQ